MACEHNFLEKKKDDFIRSWWFGNATYVFSMYQDKKITPEGNDIHINLVNKTVLTKVKTNVCIAATEAWPRVLRDGIWLHLSISTHQILNKCCL